MHHVCNRAEAAAQQDAAKQEAESTHLCSELVTEDPVVHVCDVKKKDVCR